MAEQYLLYPCNKKIRVNPCSMKIRVLKELEYIRVYKMEDK